MAHHDNRYGASQYYSSTNYPPHIHTTSPPLPDVRHDDVTAYTDVRHDNVTAYNVGVAAKRSRTSLFDAFDDGFIGHTSPVQHPNYCNQYPTVPQFNGAYSPRDPRIAQNRQREATYAPSIANYPHQSDSGMDGSTTGSPTDNQDSSDNRESGQISNKISNLLKRFPKFGSSIRIKRPGGEYLPLPTTNSEKGKENTESKVNSLPFPDNSDYWTRGAAQSESEGEHSVSSNSRLSSSSTRDQNQGSELTSITSAVNQGSELTSITSEGTSHGDMRGENDLSKCETQLPGTDSSGERSTEMNSSSQNGEVRPSPRLHHHTNNKNLSPKTPHLTSTCDRLDSLSTERSQARSSSSLNASSSRESPSKSQCDPRERHHSNQSGKSDIRRSLERANNGIHCERGENSRTAHSKKTSENIVKSYSSNYDSSSSDRCSTGHKSNNKRSRDHKSRDHRSRSDRTRDDHRLRRSESTTHKQRHHHRERKHSNDGKHVKDSTRKKINESASESTVEKERSERKIDNHFSKKKTEREPPEKKIYKGSGEIKTEREASTEKKTGSDSVRKKGEKDTSERRAHKASTEKTVLKDTSCKKNEKEHETKTGNVSVCKEVEANSAERKLEADKKMTANGARGRKSEKIPMDIKVNKPPIKETVSCGKDDSRKCFGEKKIDQVDGEGENLSGRNVDKTAAKLESNKKVIGVEKSILNANKTESEVRVKSLTSKTESHNQPVSKVARPKTEQVPKTKIDAVKSKMTSSDDCKFIVDTFDFFSLPTKKPKVEKAPIDPRRTVVTPGSDEIVRKKPDDLLNDQKGQSLTALTPSTSHTPSSWQPSYEDVDILSKVSGKSVSSDTDAKLFTPGTTASCAVGEVAAAEPPLRNRKVSKKKSRTPNSFLRASSNSSTSSVDKDEYLKMNANEQNLTVASTSKSVATTSSKLPSLTESGAVKSVRVHADLAKRSLFGDYEKGFTKRAVTPEITNIGVEHGMDVKQEITSPPESVATGHERTLNDVLSDRSKSPKGHKRKSEQHSLGHKRKSEQHSLGHKRKSQQFGSTRKQSVVDSKRRRLTSKRTSDLDEIRVKRVRPNFKAFDTYQDDVAPVLKREPSVQSEPVTGEEKAGYDKHENTISSPSLISRITKTGEQTGVLPELKTPLCSPDKNTMPGESSANYTDSETRADSLWGVNAQNEPITDVTSSEEIPSDYRAYLEKHNVANVNLRKGARRFTPKKICVTPPKQGTLDRFFSPRSVIQSSVFAKTPSFKRVLSKRRSGHSLPKWKTENLPSPSSHPRESPKSRLKNLNSAPSEIRPTNKIAGQRSPRTSLSPSKSPFSPKLSPMKRRTVLIRLSPLKSSMSKLTSTMAENTSSSTGKLKMKFSISPNNNKLTVESVVDDGAVNKMASTSDDDDDVPLSKVKESVEDDLPLAVVAASLSPAKVAPAPVVKSTMVAEISHNPAPSVCHVPKRKHEHSSKTPADKLKSPAGEDSEVVLVKATNDPESTEPSSRTAPDVSKSAPDVSKTAPDLSRTAPYQADVIVKDEVARSGSVTSEISEKSSADSDVEVRKSGRHRRMKTFGDDVVIFGEGLTVNKTLCKAGLSSQINPSTGLLYLNKHDSKKSVPKFEDGDVAPGSRLSASEPCLKSEPSTEVIEKLPSASTSRLLSPSRPSTVIQQLVSLKAKLAQKAAMIIPLGAAGKLNKTRLVDEFPLVTDANRLHDAANAVDQTKVIQPCTIPRGRGRPRKHPLTPEQIALRLSRNKLLSGAVSSPVGGLSQIAGSPQTVLNFRVNSQPQSPSQAIAKSDKIAKKIFVQKMNTDSQDIEGSSGQNSSQAEPKVKVRKYIKKVKSVDDGTALSVPSSPRSLNRKPVDQHKIRQQEKSKRLLRESLKAARQKESIKAARLRQEERLKKQRLPLLLGDRKRLSRGAKEKVVTYAENAKQFLRSDDDESGNSSSDDPCEEEREEIADTVCDGPVIAEEPTARSAHIPEKLALPDFDIHDKRFLKNPLNSLYSPELRRVALDGKENNNYLFVYNDDMDWNDVILEMPRRDFCSTKFTGVVLGSYRFPFESLRDDDGLDLDVDTLDALEKQNEELVSPRSRDRNIWDIITPSAFEEKSEIDRILASPARKELAFAKIPKNSNRAFSLLKNNPKFSKIRIPKIPHAGKMTGKNKRCTTDIGSSVIMIDGKPVVLKSGTPHVEEIVDVTHLVQDITCVTLNPPELVAAPSPDLEPTAGDLETLLQQFIKPAHSESVNRQLLRADHGLSTGKPDPVEQTLADEQITAHTTKPAETNHDTQNCSPPIVNTESRLSTDSTAAGDMLNDGAEDSHIPPIGGAVVSPAFIVRRKRFVKRKRELCPEELTKFARKSVAHVPLENVELLMNVAEALDMFLTCSEHSFLDVEGYLTADQALMVGYMCEYEVQTKPKLKLKKTSVSRQLDAGDMDAVFNNAACYCPPR